MFTIEKYQVTDWEQVLELMLREGEEWSDYTAEETREAYFEALSTSATFVAYAENQLIGFCRCRVDGLFGVYICDLLVDKEFRGKKAAQQLMEQVCEFFSDQTIYVMSDVDGFYESKGYRKEGSIFEVKSTK